MLNNLGYIFLFLCWIPVVSSQQINNKTNPEIIARRVVDRIIKDTFFGLKKVEQKPVLGIQVIDFSKTGAENEVIYAFSTISVSKPGKIVFGISYSTQFVLYLNNQIVKKISAPAQFQFKEIAYEKFVFQDSIELSLHPGINEIYFKSLSGKQNFIYLLELNKPGEKLVADFMAVDKAEYSFVWPWGYYESHIVCRQNENINSISPLTEIEIKNIYSESHSLKLFYYGRPIINKFAVIEDRTFKKDSYAEWHYANGSMMMAILNLAEALKDQQYIGFVEKYCDYTFETFPAFRSQYFGNHDLRTSNYRLFRRTMLDDTGGPVLPFVELELTNGNTKYDSLITEIGEYILHQQYRLEDGTFCRPEPFSMSLWADDLFMSVPFLVRLAKLKGEDKYYDDAAAQIVNFNSYLMDKSNGLYKHCWYDNKKSRSNVFWGRANGWIIWATAEALQYLPPKHKSYSKILELFKAHIDSLLSYQNESGMWHQIITNNNSFEETSCTAMFIIGLARGTRYGWLDKKYEKYLMKAWHGLIKNIDENGIVKNITFGTDVSDNENYYATRPRYENDPRGLGSVLIACKEMIINNSQNIK
jgi:unsaturated rhamnogalacturonyl hydrolase